MAARRRGRDSSQTPLGREYARLSSWRTAAPEHDTLPARRAVRADDLADWVASVGETKHPLLPPGTRPNPVAVGDLVLCSTFSPGTVVALDRATGTTRWSLPLDYYGHPVTPGPAGSGLVYAGTSRDLLAVKAATGRVAWAFCPYGRTGETIYSAPVAAGGRLFVGDRRGYLHCLSARIGEPVWRVLTSRAANNDVNSDPVVCGRVVAVGTNAGLAAGYEAATGRPVWRHRLVGPCTNVVPAGRGRAVFWAGPTAVLLALSDGSVLGRWRRRHHAVDQVCVAGGVTLVVTRRAWGAKGERWPVAELRGYKGTTELYRQTYPRWSMAALRHDPGTGRVYEATSHGVGVLDPRSGERELVIRFATGDLRSGRVDPPWAEGGRLYVLGEDGKVFALRLPAA